MKKKIIGYYTDSMGFGGAEVILKQIIENLDKSRYKIILFCKKEYPLISLFTKPFEFQVVFTNTNRGQINNGNNEKQAFSFPYTFIKIIWKKLPFGFLKRMIGVIRDIKRLAVILKKHNLDLLHYNDVRYEAGIIAGRFARIPIIMGTYHVYPTLFSRNRIKEIIIRIFERITFNCLTSAIVVSRKSMEMWAKRLKIKITKFQLIYNGVDLSKFRNVRIMDSPIPVIGTVSRLSPEKDNFTMLEAFKKVASYFNNTKLVIVGSGSLRSDLEQYAEKLNLKDKISFLGFRQDILEIVNKFSIFILSSLTEGVSVSLLEAMASGVPIVATNVGGNPEVVIDGVTGMLVPCRDPDKLAEAVIKLLKNETLRKKMGEAGRKRVEELFDKQKMLKATYDLYEKFLTENDRTKKLVS